MLEKLYKKSMDALHSAIYFTAMIITGMVEEMLFRGFPFSSCTDCFKEYYPLYDYTLHVKCA